jgi:methyl-accepting chemotaxis protein
LFLMSFIPTLLASFIVAVWLARRYSQRLSQIGSTLDLIAGGDLTARVPNSNQNLGDLDNVAERVNQMAQSQEYSVSALKQVSADIAHDLKTPIQRVSVLLERAKNHLGDNHTANELLSEAVSETYNIQNTFQALLQIAQIEKGKCIRQNANHQKQ